MGSKLNDGERATPPPPAENTLQCGQFGAIARKHGRYPKINAPPRHRVAYKKTRRAALLVGTHVGDAHPGSEHNVRSYPSPSTPAMVAPPDFSALHCPPRARADPPKDKVALTGWSVEGALEHHACFNPTSGEYTVAADGLYSIVVELIPIGNAHLEHEQTRRLQVEYAIRILEPRRDHPSDPADEIESEFLDVGSVNFGQVKHLRAGNVVTCLRMPAASGHYSVRLKVDCIQRKKKRPRAPEPSKKELKKRKKMKRKAESIASSLSSGTDAGSLHPFHASSDTCRLHESSDDDDSDSDWSDGFESDTTEDELPHSNRGVGRLAKRFKCSAGPNNGS